MERIGPRRVNFPHYSITIPAYPLTEMVDSTMEILERLLESDGKQYERVYDMRLVVRNSARLNAPAPKHRTVSVRGRGSGLTWSFRRTEGEEDIMNIQPVVIPYATSMQYVHGRMRKIYHDAQEWGNEIVIIFEGSATYRCNETAFPVSRGSVFVLRGDYFKELKDAERVQMCSIYYKEEDLQRLAGTFRWLEGYQRLFVSNPLARAYSPKDILQADEDLLDELEPLADRMIREQKLMGPGFEQVLNSTFFILITLISRAFVAVKNYSGRCDDGFLRAVAYMQSRYGESPRLRYLAEIACMSERHFCRRFKEVYGIPPSQYLMQLKLGRACALLEESQLSISEIAMECGFPDINYFSRCFRAAHQQTPTEYRRAHREAVRMSELKRHCL